MYSLKHLYRSQRVSHDIALRPHSSRTIPQAAIICGLLVICGCSSDNAENANVGGAKSQSGASGGGGKGSAGPPSSGSGAILATAGSNAIAGSGNLAGVPITNTAAIAGSSALGEGGAAVTGGAAAAGGVASVSSTSPSLGGAASASGSTKIPCQPVDDLRCGANNLRERCDIGGDWLPVAQQCSGATPACTGNGICAAYKLIQGSLDTFGVRAATPGASYVLLHQTLLEYPRVCSNTYCIKGGIAP